MKILLLWSGCFAMMVVTLCTCTFLW